MVPSVVLQWGALAERYIASPILALLIVLPVVDCVLVLLRVGVEDVCVAGVPLLFVDATAADFVGLVVAEAEVVLAQLYLGVFHLLSH